MNSLERTNITKVGYDHGWENIAVNVEERVVMTSAMHPAQVEVTSRGQGSEDPGYIGTEWRVAFGQPALTREVARAFPALHTGGDAFHVSGESGLGRLLRAAATLARSLPDAPEVRFEKAIADELAQAGTQRSTEAERLVRQRVGQDIFRESLMDYWGGACAVTGIAVPELLRASHIKPWAECETDSERLNVFNGLLLCAHLDALFDRHLMTFDETGVALFSPQIDMRTRRTLGLPISIRLRWIRSDHKSFLYVHRKRFHLAYQDMPAC